MRHRPTRKCLRAECWGISAICDNLEPKSETISWLEERMDFAVIREMIRPDAFNGFSSEQAYAVKLAIVEQHLTEAEIIRSR